VLTQLLVGPIPGDILPLLLIAVVLVGGWLGGTRPGLLATGLGVAILLLPPGRVGQSDTTQHREWVRAVVLLGVGTGMSAAFGIVRFKQGKAEALVSAFAARERQMREFHELSGTPAALRMTEKHFHRLAASMHQILWAALPGGRLDYCNHPYYEAFGLTEATALSATGLAATLHPEDIEPFRTTWAAALQSDEPGEIEYRLKTPREGGYRWHRGRFLAVKDEAGRVDRWFHASTDIDDQKRAEDRLLAGQRHLDAILTAVPDPFLALDPGGRVAYVNARWMSHFGKPSDEVIGQSVWKVFPEIGGTPASEGYHRVIRDRIALTFEQCSGSAGRWYEVHAFPTAEGIAAFLTDITARRAAQEAIRAALDELEIRVAERTAELTLANNALTAEVRERERIEAARTDLQRRLTIAQEEERSRIARELHDQMGQYLTALGIGLRVVREGLPDSSAAHPRLTQLQQLTDVIGREVQRLAVELRPSALDDMGLRAAVQNYLDEWVGRAEVEIDFHESGLDAGRLPKAIETTAYRVVQESLTNVLKHARAKRVNVILRCSTGRLQLAVEDDGQGFDSDAVMTAPGSGGHLGLLGMSERMAYLGGTLVIDSTPGHGTAVIARIPLPADHMRDTDE
jgi:PAS domain S-box-containing protein